MVVRRRANMGMRGLVDEGSGYRTPRARNRAVKPIPQNQSRAEAEHERMVRRELPELREEFDKLKRPSKLGTVHAPTISGWRRWGTDI